MQAEGRAPLAPLVQQPANVQQEVPSRGATEKRARKSLSTQLEESSTQAAQSRKRASQVGAQRQFCCWITSTGDPWGCMFAQQELQTTSQLTLCGYNVAPPRLGPGQPIDIQEY